MWHSLLVTISQCVESPVGYELVEVMRQVGNVDDPYFKWRGARGSRVLLTDEPLTGSLSKWQEASVWYLDMDGLEEHLRRQARMPGLA